MFPLLMKFYPSSVYVDELNHSHSTLLMRSLYVAECVNYRKCYVVES